MNVKTSINGEKGELTCSSMRDAAVKCLAFPLESTTLKIQVLSLPPELSTGCTLQWKRIFVTDHHQLHFM